MLMIMMHLPRRRSGARLGDGLTPVVWSLAESRVLWYMGVASYLERILLVMDTPDYRVPQFE